MSILILGLWSLAPARQYVGRVFFLAAVWVVACQPATAATQYTYDALSRLAQIKYDDGRSIAYTYDAAGNLLSQTRTGSEHSSDLVGLWTFDDCTARDFSGNGNHGDIGAGVTCVPGRRGMAMRFSGGQIRVPSSPTLTLDGVVTISTLVWLDADNISGAGVLQKGATNVVWDYGLVTYNQVPGYRSSDSDWLSLPAGPNAGQANAWHLFTTVVDESDAVEPVRIYVDGIALPPPIRSYNNLYSPADLRPRLILQSNQPLQMGVGHPGFPLRGAIDEVHIHARALTPAQVMQLAVELGMAP